jgi:hypothetical protein
LTMLGRKGQFFIWRRWLVVAKIGFRAILTDNCWGKIASIGSCPERKVRRYVVPANFRNPMDVA